MTEEEAAQIIGPWIRRMLIKIRTKLELRKRFGIKFKVSGKRENTTPSKDTSDAVVQI